MTRPQSAAPSEGYDAIWRDVYGDMQSVGPAHRHLRRLLRTLLDGVEYESAIEVGCGAGHNLPLLSEGRQLDALAGVDISARALEEARTRWPEAELHQLDVQGEAPAGTWDVVLCSLVLEHLEDDDAALRNMRSMCAGHLVVATIAGPFERYAKWERQVGHVRNYRVGELEAKLQRAGFTIERAIYWGFPFYSPLARRLQNFMTSKSEYDAPTSLLARVMYQLYRLNSSRRGDIVLVRARI